MKHNASTSKLLICAAVISFSFCLLLNSVSAEIHPFILYTAAEADAIRDRIGSEPYSVWFDGETAEADDILSMSVAWNETNVPPETKAYYAKVLAFSWAFSDSARENRALWEEEALLSLYHMPYGTYKPPFTSDLTVSEAALFWAEAYDILRGGGCDFTIDGYGDMEAVIRSKLKALRDYMARDSYVLLPSSPYIGTDFPSSVWIEADASDNHHVKLNAALAVLSLVINDEGGSRDDFNHALERLRDSLTAMTVMGNGDEPAGGWAEGPNYMLYSAHQYLAAVNAMKNLGEADLYTEMPELVATHLLLPHMVMPDGYMPPWDNNRAVVFDLAGLLWSYHADRPERDLLLWMWKSSGSPVPKAFRADYIAGFDNTAPVYGSPDEYGLSPTGFHTESGFARFRNSWDNDALYLLFQGEHGEAHTNGRAHEHPDQNSFILNAFGEMLVMDSGYGGWGNRDLTRFAEHHNLILVDGKGPSAAEQLFGAGLWSIGGYGAFIEDGFASPVLDYAASETLYENTFFTRRVVFPGHRYFILYDTVESGTDVEYTMLIHGNGGGTSGGTFIMTVTGGVWERERASLAATVVGSTGNIDFSSEDMYHAVYSSSPMQSHTVLKASQQGKSAGFLTLMYPYQAGETPPETMIASVVNGKGVRINRGDVREFAAFGTGDGDMTITVNGDDGIVVDSDAAFVWCEAADGTGPGRLFIDEGTYAADTDGTIVTASGKIKLTLDRTLSGIVEGHIQPKTDTELTFHGLDAENVFFNDSPVPFTAQNSDLVFTLPGDGSYRIILKSVPVTIEPPLNLTVSDYPGDHGHRLILEWTRSPSENDGIISLYRIYRSRSTEFSDPKSPHEFATLDELIAWEEYNTVLVDSVGAGIEYYEDNSVPLNGVAYYYWIEAVGNGGVSEKVSAMLPVSVREEPRAFTLYKPFPNPFNAETMIEFELDRECSIEMVVYDVRGSTVAVLANGSLPAGSHAVRWNGESGDGRNVSSGIYFISLTGGGFRSIEKVMLMK